MDEELTYFRRLRAGVDTAPFLAEIAAHEGEWQRRTGRQDIVVQRQTQAITLRGAPMGLVPPRARRVLGLSLEDSHWSVWTPESRRFPRMCRFLEDFAAERGGRLGRAMIVRLAPGGEVGEHVDGGSYYAQRDRFHLVLHSAAGSILHSGGETVTMRPGELWWFDNGQLHSAFNPAGQWRVHVIFDMGPARLKAEAAAQAQALAP